MRANSIKLISVTPLATDEDHHADDLDLHDLISVSAFAAMLGVSATVARNVVREGGVAHFKIAKKSVRIPRAEAQRYCATPQGRLHREAAERAESPPQGWLTVAQAAKVMTVSERTVIALLADGALEAEVIDGGRYVGHQEIQEYLAAVFVPARAA
ncbi:helix-turn-helix domain-containing protein [Spongiactinospora sp. TRM90649]|uniref:helix-turn-helix domain-containing protein n=1 Tax=Spongiactinospora sp. TRM90649 TaxID=3031114 RepID=UPI0023F7B884|nr:helix-turn-helix domain-containing protein [Spongiactinospora sp. TRM90649]MDF5756587.1 helix-turn-helix domain-containing protein [Spongiactinospora sp. TRM90649]